MSHIKNFYEDLRFPLASVPKLVNDVCQGRIKNITEKLDGQNFTFTVHSGFVGEEVRFLGKGVSRSLADEGGLGRGELQEKYADKPNVQKAFLAAYDAITNVVEHADQQDVWDIFCDGQVAVSAEVLCSENSNIVHYPQKSVRFIGLVPFTGIEGNRTKLDAFSRLAETLTKDNEWVVGPVPSLKQRVRLDRNDVARRLSNEFTQLCRTHGCTSGGTMGDLRQRMVREVLDDVLPRDIAAAAAWRLANEDKSALTKKQAGASWKTFQDIEARRTVVVNEALVPLEEFFRGLGAYALETVDFVLAEANDVSSVQNIINEVTRIKKCISMGKVNASPEVLERIKSAVKRCPNPELYTKNVEGIVFEWGGKTCKLVGYYTPINRLLSFFRYGLHPATII